MSNSLAEWTSPRCFRARTAGGLRSGRGLPPDSYPCLCTTSAGRWSAPPTWEKDVMLKKSLFRWRQHRCRYLYPDEWCFNTFFCEYCGLRYWFDSITANRIFFSSQPEKERKSSQPDSPVQFMQEHFPEVLKLSRLHAHTHTHANLWRMSGHHPLHPRFALVVWDGGLAEASERGKHGLLHLPQPVLHIPTSLKTFS